ncbi:hypothetical protein ACFXKR_41230 [Streptomyces violascens]|uniref:hypothetical protein n=1 Tax=Streptomyces violascens TaxID=67381 RepID=UPI00367F0E82
MRCIARHRNVIPRQHTERITDDDQDHDVRLGVWVANRKSRHDTLNEQRLAQLAALGIDWTVAAAVVAGR